MKKRYKMVGPCPIKIDDTNWIFPGQKPFDCDMDPAKEELFLKIGAIEVVSSVVAFETPKKET